MTMIPVFDLGNVVVQVDFSPFTKWVSEHEGAPSPEEVLKFHSSSLYFDFEFGNISDAEFLSRLANICNIDCNVERLAQKFCDVFPATVPGIEQLLKELSEKQKIYCLTNTNSLHLNYCNQHFDCMQYFTHIFSSFDLSKRKPYPAIYRDLSDSLGVDPKEIIFFDDIQDNVDGARKAGLNAELFESVDQVKKLLA